MRRPVRFTVHARQKLVDLAQIGFTVTEEQVVDVVLNPEFVDREADPPTAQKAVSAGHLLRVAFSETDDELLVITFYPARRSRYEPENEV